MKQSVWVSRGAAQNTVQEYYIPLSAICSASLDIVSWIQVFCTIAASCGCISSAFKPEKLPCLTHVFKAHRWSAQVLYCWKSLRIFESMSVKTIARFLCSRVHVSQFRNEVSTVSMWVRAVSKRGDAVSNRPCAFNAVNYVCIKVHTAYWEC